MSAAVPTWFDTAERRADLVRVAATLYLTPFFANSEAPGKDGGMDCVRLLNYIYRTLGVIGPCEIPRQTMDHGQHSDRPLLIEAFETWTPLRERFRRLPDCSPENILPGDALCFTAGKIPHHGAVALSADYLFHTYNPAGAHRMRINAAIRGVRLIGKLAAIYRPLPAPAP